MAKRVFMELLQGKWRERKFVCVGLDTEASKIPDEVVKQAVMNGQVNMWSKIFLFNRAIIDASAKVAGAYKLQLAYYEAQGTNGIGAMKDTVRYLHDRYPTVPVIGDGKRNDIGDTCEAYAEAMFDQYGFDAVTLNPYLGEKALEPFLRREDKGCFILCKTSNPGSGEFQDLMVEGRPLYQIVAMRVAERWNWQGNCGLVVGATYPEQLREIRPLVGTMPLLIPGVGAQGGEILGTVRAGVNNEGAGILINSSRGIIFAKQRYPKTYQGVSFAEAALTETQVLHNQICDALAAA